MFGQSIGEIKANGWCPLCTTGKTYLYKRNLKFNYATYERWEHDTPILICSLCGEQFISPDIQAQIQHCLDSLRRAKRLGQLHNKYGGAT